VTYCPASELDISRGKSLVSSNFTNASKILQLINISNGESHLLILILSIKVVLVYNSLGWNREDVIRVPVCVMFRFYLILCFH
jgi:hypothetical protein